ncbi:hypothetical protein ANN_08049 [Periplaneta americana]|uniref:Uncharacterized protein n=1 Tax=Periplaneta americana TaxID=6978 RepID=A0ABQ8T0D7_PERAM|nr:hypothetical protein ANN_08049 [Periplaneta americana]
MAGLCEGGNEPPGSLKASKYQNCYSSRFRLCCFASRHDVNRTSNCTVRYAGSLIGCKVVDLKRLNFCCALFYSFLYAFDVTYPHPLYALPLYSVRRYADFPLNCSIGSEVSKPGHYFQEFDTRAVNGLGGLTFGFRKTASAVMKPEEEEEEEEEEEIPFSFNMPTLYYLLYVSLNYCNQ